MGALRVGILGAARIAPAALIKPARDVDRVEVVAVAARDRERAGAFAARHAVPRVHESYDAMLADPEVDAVYNPLPNGLHARWTIAALAAGKHVLCEKPFTANATEAVAVVEAAERAGRVCMEAFHWRYHPLAARLLEILDGGELGAVRHLEAALAFPLPRFADIRWQLDLAGGATMDAGCYAIHIVRTLAGAEPEVVAARALLLRPEVDRRMQADLRFPDGRTGRVTASMLSMRPVLRMSARVVGESGEVRVLNPIAPQFFHRIVVRSGGRRRVEHATRTPTYRYQLEAFAAAVLDGAPVPTGGADAIANMRVIDAIYERAGLHPRGVSR